MWGLSHIALMGVNCLPNNSVKVARSNEWRSYHLYSQSKIRKSESINEVI